MAKQNPTMKKVIAVLDRIGRTDPIVETTTTARTIKQQLTGSQPALRPNGETYFPRPFAAGRTDIEALTMCRKHRQHVLLGGYPGCGKTALIEAAFGDNLITVEGNGDMEVGDLIGHIMPDKDTAGKYKWIDGPLPQAMREGKVLFIDDATLIPANVLARLYPAMDGRGKLHVRENENEEVFAKEGFFVVAAHNPGAPGAVLAEALSSRCRLQIHVASDLDLCKKLGIPQAIVRAAREMQILRDQTGDLNWAPEMRELIAFRDISAMFDERVAAENMLACIHDSGDRKAVARILKSHFAWVSEPTALTLGEKKADS